jgi:uncharacterized protein (UPF0332 family)
VKPETRDFPARAAEFLDRAPALLAQGFTDEAGRAAYLEGYHAAQALIFEKRARSPKSHSGVQAQFALIVKDEASITRDLRAFLGRAYNLKAIADYETGPNAKVTAAQATAALNAARRFVEVVAELIEDAPGSSSETET